MRIRTLIMIPLILASTLVNAQFEDPFSVSTEVERNHSTITLSVSLSVPDKMYLYADKTFVKSEEKALVPIKKPETVQKKDPVSGETIHVYASDIILEYNIPAPPPKTIVVSYQGCDDKQCFFPQNKEISLESEAIIITPAAQSVEVQPQADWCAPADNFKTIRKLSGYQKPDDFIAFLKGGNVENGRFSDGVSQAFKDKGIGLTIILIILGGLALNLTPCVLPMIPINLAIIGAGAQGSTRGRGMVLGGIYGLGIASVYGLLGLMVVLTGAKFGSLNSSPWFNLGIALLFLVMALAMFDVITIDFTRFQGKAGSGKQSKSKLLTAFIMGGVAALLAGACVAPVVISVLLLSADLYAKGNFAALALPFVLGLGMALPWPFAGAGLSFLPKPGKWMVKVKYVFGIAILVFSFWYGQQFVTLISHHNEASILCQMLTKAQSAGKPVLIDFRASWCKNCLKMEKTTFRDPEVVRQMEAFSTLFFNAENLNDKETRTVLDYYGIIGLPTYVILEVNE